MLSDIISKFDLDGNLKTNLKIEINAMIRLMDMTINNIIKEHTEKNIQIHVDGPLSLAMKDLNFVKDWIKNKTIITGDEFDKIKQIINDIERNIDKINSNFKILIDKQKKLKTDNSFGKSNKKTSKKTSKSNKKIIKKSSNKTRKTNKKSSKKSRKTNKKNK